MRFSYPFSSRLSLCFQYLSTPSRTLSFFVSFFVPAPYCIPFVYWGASAFLRPNLSTSSSVVGGQPRHGVHEALYKSHAPASHFTWPNPVYKSSHCAGRNAAWAVTSTGSYLKKEGRRRDIYITILVSSGMGYHMSTGSYLGRGRTTLVH